MYQYPYGNAQQLNLDWILNKLQEIKINATPELLTEVANALIAHSFDSSIPYGISDFVFNPNDQKLYICKTISYPAGGSEWNSAYWDECLVGDILTPVRNMAYHHATLLTTYDDTDRTSDIINQLNAYRICVLGNGVFYTSGLLMPDKTTLKGVAADSVIRLINGNNKSAVVVGSECTVENVQLWGADSDITLNSTIGSRYGIEWSDNQNTNSTIHNCRIKRFNGAGILLKDTSTLTYKGVMISDCYLTNNCCGIYVQKDSEYNKITNCIVTQNYYGIINRGGNNIVANCGFNANNINAQVNDDEGSNNGHGSFIGCTFNHAGNNSGISLHIKGTGRMLLSSCNFYYGRIILENTNGNVFSGCGFGNSTPIDLITNGCDIFCGCMFKSAAASPITITGVTITKFTECYTRDGDPFESSLTEYAYLGNNTNRVKQIANGTNYDTLTSAGTYCCPDSAAAATMINAPAMNAGHTLYVFTPATNGTTITQLVVMNYDTSGMMVRTKQSYGNFGNWHYVTPIKITDTVNAGSGTQSFNHQSISAGVEIVDVQFGTPENVGSDVTLTPADGSMTITGTFYGSTTVQYFAY